MTNQQGAPEALRLAAEVLDWMPTSDTQRALWDRHQKALVVVKAALVEAQQPAQSAAAASKAVLAAISAANMQLVRTGDDEFMLVTYKNAKAQCDGGQCGIGGYCDDCPTPQADSQPAPVLDSLALMKVVMRADEALAGRCTRGTTNWAAAIGKAVQDAVLAARAPADSVTAPAGGAVAEVMMAIRPPKASPAWLPHKIIHASLQWLDSVPVGTKLYATPPAQAADSVLEDAARWQMVALISTEVMMHPDRRSNPAAVKAYMDAIHSGLDLTGAIDAARKQGGANG